MNQQKAQRRKTGARKSRVTSKAADPKSSSASGEKTKVARLTNELNEARQQLTATADVLNIISRSTFDLAKVLNTLLESAARLCEADKGVILRPAGDARYYVAATFRHTPEFIESQNGQLFAPGRNSVFGRVLQKNKSVQIPDVLADPEYALRETARLGGFRTNLGVPLLRERIPIGVLLLHRAAVRPFTEKQIKLVETFADQAVIAIENVRLFEAEQQRTRELAESLEQQTATSEVLQVISRSTFDLQKVLNTLVESAARLCEADMAIVHRLEGSISEPVATYGITPDLHEQLKMKRFEPGRATVAGRVLLERRAVHVHDVRSDAEYPMSPEAKMSGVRTALGVPLLREGTAIGMFVVMRRKVQPFTERQIGLLSTFADQAVIAIENTRLFDAEQQRTRELSESLEQQTATSEVLQVISRSAFDLEAVLTTLVESAARLCEADSGVILRPIGKSAGYRMAASYGHTPEFIEHTQTLTLEPGRGGVNGRVLLEGRSVQIPDVLADPEYTFLETARLGNVRTILGVPLLREGTPVGIFNLHRAAVRPFTEKQIKLVETFADQAVIAIENVRLFEAEQQRTRELTESLEQQTATSEVLKVISGSPGELGPVFQAMLENAVRLCSAKFGVLALSEGDAFRAVALHGAPPAYAEVRRREPLMRFGPGTTGSRATKTKQPVQIADIRAEPAYANDPQRLAFLELAGARTVLAVPMLKEDEAVGVIWIYRQEVRPFTDKQIELMQNFAAQAVIAIENARLLHELRQRTDDLSKRTTDLTEALEQQTATSEVLQVISRSPGELEPVFRAMLENAIRVCQAKFGIMFLYDGEAFRTAALHGVSPAYAEARRKKIFVVRDLHPNVPVARVARTNEVVHIADATLEQGYVERDPLWIEFVDLGGGRSLVAVPMLKENELIGAFTLYRQEVRPFTDKQIELVQNFASQAVIAIENTRLLTELRHRTDDLGRSVNELRALGEVSQAVNSTLDLQAVLSTIVAKAVQLSGTEAGAIYVFDNLRREFHLRATYGMDQELIGALAREHIGLDDPNVVQALAQHEPMQITDLKEQTRSAVNAPDHDLPYMTEVMQIILRAGFRALLVALLLRGEEIVGMLVVRRRTPGIFPQNTIDLIKTFAAQSAVAIQNARLFQDVETSLEDLRTAQDRLVQTQKLASLGQLTAGIAHEIKNPLNFVNNFSAVSAELMDELREALDGVTLEDKTRAEITELADTLRDNLDKVVQHGKRADAIVKNMLLHSRRGIGRTSVGRCQRPGRGKPQSRLSRCSRREAGLQYHHGKVL